MMLPFVVAAYLIGMIVFLVKAVFDLQGWIYIFFTWEKTVGGGFLVWYLLAKYSRQRRLVMPIVWLSFTRFLWEVVSWIFAVHINNKWAVMGLFMIFTLTAAYACLQRESKIAKFLDKNSP